MRRIRTLVVVALGALVIGTAGVAQAAGTATVTVSATVQAACTFNSNGTMDFGSLPIIPANTPATMTQPTLTCTNGTAYTITDDDGVNELAANANRMRQGATANYIAYSFNYTAGGTGNGNVQTMDIAGLVTAAAYTGAVAGVYNDVVTLTINP